MFVCRCRNWFTYQCMAGCVCVQKPIPYMTIICILIYFSYLLAFISLYFSSFLTWGTSKYTSVEQHVYWKYSPVLSINKHVWVFSFFVSITVRQERIESTLIRRAHLIPCFPCDFFLLINAVGTQQIFSNINRNEKSRAMPEHELAYPHSIVRVFPFLFFIIQK